MQRAKQTEPGTIIGIIIILIGGAFLMSNLGIIEQENLRFIFKWQTMLILIGMIVFFSSGNKSTGIIVALVGIMGLIPDFWATALILAGVYIIYKQKGVSQTNPNFTETSTQYESDVINDISIFGGSKKSFQSNNFRGGNITSIFGGSEIDLMDSTLADGENILNVFFLFGGSKFKIPSDWNVAIDVIPIFGSFKDKRIIKEDMLQNDSRLIIKGITLFGGGEINNYVSF